MNDSEFIFTLKNFSVKGTVFSRLCSSAIYVLHLLKVFKRKYVVKYFAISVIYRVDPILIYI